MIPCSYKYMCFNIYLLFSSLCLSPLEVKMVMSQDLLTCESSPTRITKWLTCRATLLPTVLGKVFQHISMIPSNNSLCFTG